VRVERRRTKKLIAGFHFLRTDQTRWKCGECRAQGLESRRRCGFLPEAKRAAKRLVWVKPRVGLDECPKSYVTAESAELVEKFVVWKVSGGGAWDGLRAREGDAFQVLEEEWRASTEAGVTNGN
jgi:hypothetical protein